MAFKEDNWTESCRLKNIRVVWPWQNTRELLEKLNWQSILLNSCILWVALKSTTYIGSIWAERSLQWGWINLFIHIIEQKLVQYNIWWLQVDEIWRQFYYLAQKWWLKHIDLYWNGNIFFNLVALQMTFRFTLYPSSYFQTIETVMRHFFGECRNHLCGNITSDYYIRLWGQHSSAKPSGTSYRTDHTFFICDWPQWQKELVLLCNHIAEDPEHPQCHKLIMHRSPTFCVHRSYKYLLEDCYRWSICWTPATRDVSFSTIYWNRLSKIIL